MSVNETNHSPKNKIRRRIINYIKFDILMICLPISINFIISLTLHLQLENIYCGQLCVMTLVLSSTSIKCIIENKAFKKNEFINSLLMSSNLLIGVISIFSYILLEYMLQKKHIELIRIKPFFIFSVLYIFNIILGLLVQIGDEIL